MATNVTISIHTPLAGSDFSGHSSMNGENYFNPHSPCGERPTPPPTEEEKQTISIHTPLAGSDSPIARKPPISKYFNPHSPCGERP